VDHGKYDDHDVAAMVDPRPAYTALCNKMRDNNTAAATVVDQYRYLMPSCSRASAIYTVDTEFGLCACVRGQKTMPFASTKLLSMNVSRFHFQILQQCHKLAVVAPSSKYTGKDFFHSLFNASIRSINLWSIMVDVQICEMLCNL